MLTIPNPNEHQTDTLVLMTAKINQTDFERGRQNGQQVERSRCLKVVETLGGRVSQGRGFWRGVTARRVLRMAWRVIKDGKSDGQY